MNEFIRVRLDLAYDGTDFAGWARQPGLRTVEGALDDGLARLLRGEQDDSPLPRFTVAGRTDSGVHARGQVAHFDIEAGAWARLPGRSAGSGRSPEEALVARLASVLPTDVVVRSAMRAPKGFDARFSALRRRYTYRIADAPRLRDPLRRRQVLWSRKPLDTAAMDDAVRPLIGVRDFASYCKPRPGATTIRELQHIAWERPADGPDAGLVVGHVVADAFCHNMVRALVGASMGVGEGRRPVSWPAELLASRRRDAGVFVVPPEGLCLEEIMFPPDEELAARADAVRAKRMDEDVWDTSSAK